MKSTTLLLVALLAATAMLVAGCPRVERLKEAAGQGSEAGSGESAGQGPGLAAEVPEEIGVYPGASKVGSGREFTVSGLRVEGTVRGTTYHVDQGYDEVAAWYRDQLQGEVELAATISGARGSGKGTIFLLLSGTGVGAAVTVAAADEGTGTTINIGEWEGSVREGG